MHFSRSTEFCGSRLFTEEAVQQDDLQEEAF